MTAVFISLSPGVFLYNDVTATRPISGWFGRHPKKENTETGDALTLQIVMGGNLDDIRNYVAAGRVDEQNKFGNTALHMSAKYGTVEIARLLVESKAALDIQDENGLTALHSSAESGTAEIARLLVDSKAALDIQDRVADSPFELFPNSITSESEEDADSTSESSESEEEFFGDDLVLQRVVFEKDEEVCQREISVIDKKRTPC
uniref:Protein phosphatase 1 regulatory subunit 12B-like n=1 Tax=Saccoglossus kowalevskii TaxID=10224 RepID=A0ABM0MI09_SACKO|nr:PREDICTED: protein phosphatase 1 regulatory subunit 12B-like [Saccoglossus kowalevskii]